MFHLPAFIIIQIYAIIKIYISNKKFSFNSHNKPSEKFVEIPLDFSGRAVLSHGASFECQNPAPAFCRNYSWHSAQSISAPVSRAPPDNALFPPLPRLRMPHQINIPPQSGGYFRFGHSPNTTGNAQVRFLLACQPRIGLLATRKRVSGIVKTYLITFSIHL